MRVAINGFGRIGRSVFRILDKRADAELVAINDLFDHDALRYLLNYDTVMGRFEGALRLEGNELVTSHGRTRMLREKDPLKLPWREIDIDVGRTGCGGVGSGHGWCFGHSVLSGLAGLYRTSVRCAAATIAACLPGPSTAQPRAASSCTATCSRHHARCRLSRHRSGR